MKIIYDHQIFGQQQYGGISRYINEIAQRIPAIGQNDVETFCPVHVNAYLNPNVGKAFPRLRVPNRKNFRRAASLINNAMGRVLVQRRCDIDIFHETYYSSTSYAPNGAKRVLTVHDMIHERFSGMFPANDRTSAIKHQAVARADHIICVSENTRRDLVELLDIPNDKTSVVYHGYSLTNVPLRSTEKSGSHKPFLLYVGHRAGYKNFAALLTAFARSPRLRNDFSLVCFGGGNFSADELRLMDSLVLSPENIVARHGDDAALSNLYSTAAALVYPSLYEGFGIPPLEAMSHDCPVICSNSSSLPEAVGDSAETFDPSQVDDIQRAIEKVVFSTEYRLELIARGRERVRMFSWEKCAEDTLRIYEQLLP